MKTENWTEEEVRIIINIIYSEFAELPLNQHTPYSLRRIIENKVEKNPFKSIQIFKYKENTK